jgi:hypothetical protein
MRDVLECRAEFLQSELEHLNEKFLKMAKNLNPHLPMGDGFKNQWIDARQACNAKEAELRETLKELDELNGNDDYREKYLHF